MFENQDVKRLTIEDIETKQFRLVARGYEQREVDEFLDSICDEIELLQGEIDEMKRKLELANAESRKAQAAGGFVRPAEPAASTADAAFREILEMAQRVKEQTIVDAEEKAQEIRDNAEKEVNARLGGLMEEKERLEKAVGTLKASAREYKEKISELLKKHQEALAQIDLGDDAE